MEDVLARAAQQGLGPLSTFVGVRKDQIWAPRAGWTLPAEVRVVPASQLAPPLLTCRLPRLPPPPPLQLWIGGQWVDAVSGKTFPVLDPRTGEEVFRVAGEFAWGWVSAEGGRGMARKGATIGLGATVTTWPLTSFSRPAR